MRADPVKNIAEVGERVDVAELARGNQAVDDSGPFRTGIASREHPVAAADGYWPKNSLRQVVVYVKIAVVEVWKSACKRDPPRG